ncbi:PfkB family carbohydrate kinase [Myxococcus sp. MxC21-1]|uniref:PfkB family carbohydrate kinase n=1 Tax=Myxococcus sp. MxC21-1 TaxID=3041439 RepID=UPI002930A326|nr:PfkB family carbohydrate kinase [Myxococcus sp. MxC21-1]WNZ64425.1 PfkB family carbohydrate kinase [Myxococcus sp. MxC21-1]
MPHIVTLTLNPTIDVATSVPEVTPEHKLRCGPVRRDPGGGGINVARVVRELGGEAIAVYTRGGATGSQLEELLEEKGLLRRSVPLQDATRESFTVAEGTGAREYRFILPGPTLSEREWQRCLNALEDVAVGAAFIVASGSRRPAYRRTSMPVWPGWGSAWPCAWWWTPTVRRCGPRWKRACSWPSPTAAS